MIPQIGQGNIEYETIPYSSFTYRLTDKQMVGRVDKLPAIAQAVMHILSTERYSKVIYPDNYGVELEKYMGTSFGYVEATIQRTLDDALLQDDRILRVEVTKVTQIEADAAHVEFTVYSKEGAFELQVTVHV